MQVRHWIWWACALFTAVLAGCAGGSGSSGFDISPDAENLAIAQALDQGACVEEHLAICPADAGALSVPPGSPVDPLNLVGVDVSVGETDTVTCVPVGSGNTCAIRVSFTPMGFDLDTGFRVAARSASPSGDWQIGPQAAVISTEPPAFQADVEVPTESSAIQLAVLVFLDPTRGREETLPVLGQSGADFAFVTPELLLAPVLPQSTR